MAKKGTNIIHKLDKETRDRHFPEYNGGKGSYARKSTASSREVFKSNYDKIDWSKQIPSTLIGQLRLYPLPVLTIRVPTEGSK